MNDTLSHTVILFQSTSHVMKAQEIVRRGNISCELIPVPRTISSQCGICIRLATDDSEEATRLLKNAHIVIENKVNL